MKTNNSSRARTACVALAALALLPVPAPAHTGVHVPDGLAAGLAHALTGVDHLLALLAVGLWASGFRAAGRIVLPGAFLAVTAAGAGLALLAVPLPLVEPVILLSLLVLGTLVAGAVRAPLGVGAMVMGAFALFHGYAHGSELAAGSGAVAFALGLAAAGVALQAAGLLAGLALRRLDLGWLARAAGGAVALAGIGLAAS